MEEVEPGLFAFGKGNPFVKLSQEFNRQKMPRVEMIESFSALKERFEQDHLEAMKKIEEVD